MYVVRLGVPCVAPSGKKTIYVAVDFVTEDNYVIYADSSFYQICSLLGEYLEEFHPGWECNDSLEPESIITASNPTIHFTVPVIDE